VDATDGQVLMYGAKVATTVYSSSTGGRSESAADAWGGGAPYLVSVEDPYDTVSPWHSWGPTPFTAKELVTALGLSGKPVDATVTRNGSKRVSQLDVVLRGQSDASFTGPTIAADLDLRSSWFSVTVLSLQPPSPNVTVSPGTTVTLGGVVRGVKSVYLQQRPNGGVWTNLATLPAGNISVDVAPTVTTHYRLATGADAAAPIRINVGG
jgi:stage II sporulation protein D